MVGEILTAQVPSAMLWLRFFRVQNVVWIDGVFRIENVFRVGDGICRRTEHFVRNRVQVHE